MNTAPTSADAIASRLPQQAGRLSRLILRAARTGLTRSETSVLAALSSGPQRVTALAEHEGLAQPTMTGLVGRLERGGLVARRRDDSDGRAVLIALTPAGHEVLSELRARYSAVLRDCLEAMPAAQVEALVAGSEALETLLTHLHAKEPA